MAKQLSGSDRVSYHEELELIYTALKEKGYDPERQIAGFLITQDPTYITAHNGARKLAGRLDTVQIITDMIRFYIEQFIETVKQ